MCPSNVSGYNFKRAGLLPLSAARIKITHHTAKAKAEGCPTISNYRTLIQRMMTTTNRSKGKGDGVGSKKALADAFVGVIASLISTMAFYPVDVWKTSLQADGVVNHNNDETDTRRGSGSVSQQSRATTTVHRLQFLLTKLFRGLPHKLLHTMGSSFTYFFVYSLVQTKYAAYVQSRRRRVASASSTGGATSNNTTIRTSTATRLLLTAFAAVINTCITLPLDTISSRKQAGTTSTSSDAPTITVTNETANSNNSYQHNAHFKEDDGRDEGLEDNINGQRRRRQQLYIKSPSKYRFSFSTNLVQEAFAIRRANSAHDINNPLHQHLHQRRLRYTKQLQYISSLWNGLFPATLLCTNPAIQYTMYDTLKNALIQYKWNNSSMMSIGFLSGNEEGKVVAAADAGQTQSSNRNVDNDVNSASKNLSMWEAFVFGLISKFMATILTYPLIRCKVMLMVSPPDAFEEQVGEEDDDASEANNMNDTNHDCRADTTHSFDGNSYNGNVPRDHNQLPQTHCHQHNNRLQQQKQQQQHEKKIESSSNKYSKSLPKLLLQIFKTDGIRGVYKGCSLQLLHTILKSALLMMIREKITITSYNFFQVTDE